MPENEPVYEGPEDVNLEDFLLPNMEDLDFDKIGIPKTTSASKVIDKKKKKRRTKMTKASRRKNRH